jgi:hypothetical protein
MALPVDIPPGALLIDILLFDFFALAIRGLRIAYLAKLTGCL